MKCCLKCGFEIENDDILTFHSVCEKEYGTICFTGISGAENRPQININDFMKKCLLGVFIAFPFVRNPDILIRMNYNT